MAKSDPKTRIVYRQAKKKKSRHHAKKNLLGGTGKIPAAATIGTVVSVGEIYDGYKQTGVRGAVYHASGYDYVAKTFSWQAAFNTWKPALAGSAVSYIASRVGAAKVTGKVPMVGKFLRL